jgi:hypothetical protein
MGIISRVAGRGTAGSSGDDGPATNALGVAVTADGGFLIADDQNNVVRKVSVSGVITRVAGTGSVGNSGDDGLATSAQLHTPARVAVTADGTILISDAKNNEIRMVTPTA